MESEAYGGATSKEAEGKEQEERTESFICFNPPLYLQRYNYIYDLLFKANPRIERLADIGCAEGKFVQFVKKLPFLTQLLAVDVSKTALEETQYRSAPIPWDYIFGRFVELELSLIQADITIKDPRFQGLDAITSIEMIEHLPAKQLEAFPETVFGFFRPRMLILTTPNREFNVFFPQLRDSGKFRNYDHKFEWTRLEFQSWCHQICSKFKYKVTFDGVGLPPSSLYGDVGHCSQIAIFERIPDMMDLSSICISPQSPPVSSIMQTYVFPKRDGSPKKYQPIDWDAAYAESDKDCNESMMTS